MWTRSHEEFFLIECTSSTLDEIIHDIYFIRSIEVPVRLLGEEGSRRNAESGACESNFSRSWYDTESEIFFPHLLCDSDECEVCRRS